MLCFCGFSCGNGLFHNFLLKRMHTEATIAKMKEKLADTILF